MKTVFVGLSGGVDSAVSAYLLKKEGYRVVGAFIKVWEPDFLPCTSGEDRLSAMRVAAHLKIPFITYDLAKEYKQSVVDYFIEEYKVGRTPNPDVMCNREIKFGAFWERAKADGADMIATGHYARKQLLSSHSQLSENDGHRMSVMGDEAGVSYALVRGTDEGKDQSYFLWTLTQDDLSHSLFPIGHLEKSKVRRIATRAGLPNATKKDSQGLCFLGHVDMKEFLQHYIPIEHGPIYGTEGELLGEHDGAAFYTIGERVPVRASVGKRYVVSKDMGTNTLTVSSSPAARKADAVNVAVGQLHLRLERVNWVRQKPEEGKIYEAEVRYHGEKHPMCVEHGSLVHFEKPVLAAAGQSLVVYDKNSGECLGGGIIESCTL